MSKSQAKKRMSDLDKAVERTEQGEARLDYSLHPNSRGGDDYLRKRNFSVPKLEAFKQEFRQSVEALPGVSRVEFFGSIAGGNYVPGISDLDVFVHGIRYQGKAKSKL